MNTCPSGYTTARVHRSLPVGAGRLCVFVEADSSAGELDTRRLTEGARPSSATNSSERKHLERERREKTRKDAKTAKCGLSFATFAAFLLFRAPYAFDPPYSSAKLWRPRSNIKLPLTQTVPGARIAASLSATRHCAHNKRIHMTEIEK
jgi:hypothetical protein